jgi:hypothetical protein
VTEAVAEEERPVLLVEVVGHGGVRTVRQVVGLIGDGASEGDPEVVGLVLGRQRASLAHFFPSAGRRRHDVRGGGGNDVDEVVPVQRRAADVLDPQRDRGRDDGHVIAVVVARDLDGRALRGDVLELLVVLLLRPLFFARGLLVFPSCSGLEGVARVVRVRGVGRRPVGASGSDAPFANRGIAAVATSKVAARGRSGGRLRSERVRSGGELRDMGRRVGFSCIRNRSLRANHLPWPLHARP